MMFKANLSILVLLSLLVLSQLVIHTDGKYIRASRRWIEEEQDQQEGAEDEPQSDTEESEMEPPPETEAETEPESESETEPLPILDGEEGDMDDQEINEEDFGEALDEEIDELVEESGLTKEVIDSGLIVETLIEEAVEEALEEGDDYYMDEDIDEEGSGPKPIMHTFYQRIDPEHHHTGTTYNQGTGMSSDKGHLDLLATWTYAWEDAGFETRILNIEDVKNHEKYDKIRDFLDHEAFGEYDELCFLRWFAMVTVGGGWMSDYDVVPLKSLVPDDYFGVPKRLSKKDMDGNNGIPLPHKGQFTVYDSGRVPSLMSGSAKEWERLAQALLQLAHDHTDDFYSDMYALLDYDKKKSKAFMKESQVVDKLSDVISVDGVIDCEKVWKVEKEHFWTVHFSHMNIHDAVDQGILEGTVSYDDRPWIAREFIQDWKKQCGESFKDIS